jgi:hypothetical protein
MDLFKTILDEVMVINSGMVPYLRRDAPLLHNGAIVPVQKDLESRATSQD